MCFEHSEREWYFTQNCGDLQNVYLFFFFFWQKDAKYILETANHVDQQFLVKSSVMSILDITAKYTWKITKDNQL